ncbi:MAG: Stp1/IreP family PP2C-type Ser/Thr phosphatase [Bacilli bacterium]|nr:Stp1/IreP family PP2C-type Ser/Thr phosphatase [Bacilli bacterium]
MRSFYLTDVGRVRSHNEDSVTILKNQANEYLMVVADGMGGHRKGEVASSLVVTFLGKRFTEMGTLGTKIDAINWLKNILDEMNQLIIDYGNTHIDSSGLGTTVVIALVTNEFLIIGNVGDSSGYVIKNNKLHKVTRPHTLVNLLVEAGDLTEEEARNHPKKNVLLKALGSGEKAEPDVLDVDNDCDAVMLCSDGLTNMLTDEQIEKVLLDDTLELEEKIIKLIRKSNVRGGVDNVSIAYLERKGSETL